MKKKISTTDLAKALYEATKDLKGDKLRAVIEQFASFLGRSHRTKQAPKIIESFIRIAKRENGEIPIDVITARPISDRELIKIGNIFSHSAEVTPLEDPAILGGFIARTEELVFDGSVRKQLSLLKQKLS